MRYYGLIGYGITKETSQGVWEPTIIERPYYGDVTRNTRRFPHGESINNDVVISNEISIVADPFAYENVNNIRYIEWSGAKWKIESVSIQRPRIVLTIGGVWNESDEG